MMQTVLLVEDNEAICMGLDFLFQSEGIQCLMVHDIKTAKSMIDSASDENNCTQIDLALLDIALPDGSGYELCRWIKSETKIPVIFLTARDDENDVVLGFDLGADDYIIKPFRNRELVSRVKHILKHNKKDSVITYAGISIDSDAGKVIKDGQVLELTKLEYKILLILFSNPSKLFTREEILSSIWDMAGKFVNDNTLTVYIKRIREKIGDQDGTIIETVRGMGYRLGVNK